MDKASPNFRGFEVAENFGKDNVWTFSACLAKLRYPVLKNTISLLNIARGYTFESEK